MLGAAMVLLGSLVAISLRAFAEAAFLTAYGPQQMPWLLIANASGFAVATLGYDAITRVVARFADLTGKDTGLLEQVLRSARHEEHDLKNGVALFSVRVVR